MFVKKGIKKAVSVLTRSKVKPCPPAALSARSAAPYGCVWIYVSTQLWAGGLIQTWATRVTWTLPRPQRPAVV